jgi:hypothetical protein
LLPRGATNRHFGRMLTPLVEVVGNFGGGPGREDPPISPCPLTPQERRPLKWTQSYLSTNTCSTG